MAKCDVKMPEDFLLKLSRLGSNMDSIAETVLEAGGEVVLEKVQGNLAAVIGAGTHDALMDSCEEYRMIAQTQMGDGKEAL